MAELVVVTPGALTLVQDRGRPGYAAIGVSASGAFDVRAYETGGRLLGNPEGAAALEVLLGGLVVRARASTRAVLTGGLVQARVAGRPVGYGEPFPLLAGEELRVGQCSRGIRTYLSLAGGVLVRPVLGSRATDTLSTLGPPPLAAGDVLPLGRPADATTVVVAPLTPPPDGLVTLDVLPGPRSDWLADPQLPGDWTVAPDSNRVGVRLLGDAWSRAHAGELASEGVVRGAIQLPPDGRPVIFGPDHPTTGGYPVVGVLTDQACDLLAQLRPGQRVRFRTSGK
ncbi:MAG: biotin-dependent carboxyltransferase family protein [Actinobacteria bacterium]|nr:biotin-dependent carboxyltransferase family protein [Actinomycetota bacterium]